VKKINQDQLVSKCVEKLKHCKKGEKIKKKFESPRLFVIVKKMVEAKLIKTVVFQVIESISIVEHTCACANSLL
jgi:hypothetical protein